MALSLLWTWLPMGTLDQGFKQRHQKIRVFVYLNGDRSLRLQGFIVFWSTYTESRGITDLRLLGLGGCLFL